MRCARAWRRFGENAQTRILSDERTCGAGHGRWPGIGREAALLLSAAGARVMVVSRSATELAAVGLEYVVADLGTAEGCALAVAETERRLGPIDVLVVNHGIGSAHERLVWEQDPEVWRETMRINLDGPFELARLTVGGMCKRGFGRLVLHQFDRRREGGTVRQRVYRLQAWCHRARTRGRPGRRAVRRHIKRSAAWLGANGNGRALGEGGSRTARYQRRAGVARARRHLPAEPCSGSARGRAGDRVPVQRRCRGVNGEAITVALGGMW